MTDLESRILQEANRAREARGARHLAADPVLAQVARSYSRLMAEREFFSHHAPVPGLEDLTRRVEAGGGHFAGLGENIALHPVANASARDFMDGWLASPGHRANLLAPEWEVSGVGVFATEAGQIFATQLFGIPSPIIVCEVKLETRPATWFVVRVDMQIGAGHALGAFVRNRFIASTEADTRGRVMLECEIPSEPGQHHVGFGRRRAGSSDGWIGICDGVVEIQADNSGIWRPAAGPAGDLVIHEGALYRISGSELDVCLAGEARRRGIVVVDGSRTVDIEPGHFATRLTLRAGTGVHMIDLGLPEVGGCYRVVRSFRMDTDRGEFREE